MISAAVCPCQFREQVPRLQAWGLPMSTERQFHGVFEFGLPLGFAPVKDRTVYKHAFKACKRRLVVNAPFKNNVFNVDNQGVFYFF